MSNENGVVAIRKAFFASVLTALPEEVLAKAETLPFRDRKKNEAILEDFKNDFVQRYGFGSFSDVPVKKSGFINVSKLIRHLASQGKSNVEISAMLEGDNVPFTPALIHIAQRNNKNRTVARRGRKPKSESGMVSGSTTHETVSTVARKPVQSVSLDEIERQLDQAISQMSTTNEAVVADLIQARRLVSKTLLEVR